MTKTYDPLSPFHKLRVRVSGLLIWNGKILLINHKNLTKSGDFWSPPGGGVSYGESTKSALEREFREEVNLKIEVNKFITFNEFLEMPLHAIELFYSVSGKQSKPKLGYDPELSKKNQIMTSFSFFDKKTIVNNKTDFHPILRNEQILGLL